MSQSQKPTDILGETLGKFEEQLRHNLQENSLLFKELRETTHVLGEQVNSISKKIDVVDKLVDLKVKHLDEVVRENREQTEKSIKLIQEEHFNQTEQISGLDRLMRAARYWFIAGVLIFICLFWIFTAYLQHVNSGQILAIGQINQQIIQSMQNYYQQTNRLIVQSNKDLTDSLRKEILSTMEAGHALQKKNQQILTGMEKSYPKEMEEKNKELLEAIQKNSKELQKTKELLKAKLAKPKAASSTAKKTAKLPSPATTEDESAEKSTSTQEETPAYEQGQTSDETGIQKETISGEETTTEESMPVALPGYSY